MMEDAEFKDTKDFIFRDAVKFLKSKKVLPAEEYKILDRKSQAAAFTVSGYTAAEILQEFLASLEKAVEEGKTKAAYREEMNHFLNDHGYEGINPWKSDTIFRTNIQTAFNAGHYKSMTIASSLRPYWCYMTAGDGRVRDTHAVMHGRVYRADDPIWNVWFPPNGFKCRCTVVSYTEAQVERYGLKVENKPPINIDYETGEIVTRYPDKGFSGNPAKTIFKPDLSVFSAALKKAYKNREKNKPK